MSNENLLWVDKHRPATFSSLTYHDGLTERLRHLSSSADMPHLLFYGPSGAGKRTRVGCVLRNLFGPGVDKKKIVHRVFKVGDSSKQVEVTTVASTHHIEVNPSESGINDRLVIQELIKDMASSAPLPTSVFTSAKTDGASNGDDAANDEGASNNNSTKTKMLKVIVLHEVDQMTRLAQQALRRTMERCLGVRVPHPSKTEVVSVLHRVAALEGLTVPDTLYEEIFRTSGEGNVRRAILQLEATRVSVGNMVLPDNCHILLGDWEYACDDLAKLMTRQQSAQQLMTVRKRFQDLLSHAVSPQIILNTLVRNILKIVDDEISFEICRVAAKFDRNLNAGTKPIFHLEAFAARFMQIYSSFLQAQAAMMD